MDNALLPFPCRVSGAIEQGMGIRFNATQQVQFKEKEVKRIVIKLVALAFLCGAYAYATNQPRPAFRSTCCGSSDPHCTVCPNGGCSCANGHCGCS